MVVEIGNLQEMIHNTEGIQKYHYPVDLSKNRKGGVSAFLRCKNEEEFIVPSLLSVKNFFDEIVVILNCCTDRTEELIRKLNLPNVKIFYYPFEIVSAGPLTKDLCVNSIKNIVFYTNYCISLTTREWVYRFDGDNIALPCFYDLKNIIACDKYDSIEDRAWDLVGPKCDMLGSQEMVSFEARLIRIKDNVRYILSANQFAEQAYVPGSSFRVNEPTFVHMKHSKIDPQHQWNEKERSMDHFKSIIGRHVPVKKYNGEYPEILKKYLELNRDSDELIKLYNNGLLK